MDFVAEIVKLASALLNLLTVLAAMPKAQSRAKKKDRQK